MSYTFSQDEIEKLAKVLYGVSSHNNMNEANHILKSMLEAGYKIEFPKPRYVAGYVAGEDYQSQAANVWDTKLNKLCARFYVPRALADAEEYARKLNERDQQST